MPSSPAIRRAAKHRLTTYSPETALGEPLYRILWHFLSELRRIRWQIWIAFRRDFSGRHSQTVLGVFWSLLLPLIPVTVYLLLAHVRVLKTTDDMPFVVYIVLGMTIWTFLSGTILSSIAAIPRAKTILETSRYPVLAEILSNFGQMMFELTVRSAFLIVVLLLFDVSLHWSIFLLPLVMLPLILFGLGAGIFLSILNVIIKDVSHTVEIVLRYGLFLSSVIFPMPESGVFARFNMFNPFNTFVVAVRDFVVLGQLSNLNLFLITSLIGVFLFLFSCKVLYTMEFRIKAYL